MDCTRKNLIRHIYTAEMRPILQPSYFNHLITRESSSKFDSEDVKEWRTKVFEVDLQMQAVFLEALTWVKDICEEMKEEIVQNTKEQKI